MIKDVEGMNSELSRLLARHLQVSQYVDLGREALAIIDSFDVEEPLTVARILCQNAYDHKVQKVIADWLYENDYDGLWHNDGEPHCGCSLDDFAPCGCPEPDCRPAYRHKDGCMYLEEEKDES